MSKREQKTFVHMYPKKEEIKALRLAVKRSYVFIDSEDSHDEDSQDESHKKKKKSLKDKKSLPKRQKLETNKKPRTLQANRSKVSKTVKKCVPKKEIDNNGETSSTVNAWEENAASNATKKSNLKDVTADQVLWDIAEVIATCQCTTVRVAQNVVRLFDEDNTIPFIARYRKGLTDGMEAEQLVAMKEAYEELKLVVNKAHVVLRQVKRTGLLTNDIRNAVLSCQSLAELDLVAAPFKPGAKTTLAERARSLGLEDAALVILWGKYSSPNLHTLVQHGKDGLKSVQEVELGLQHIIADVVSKTKEVLTFVRELRGNEYITLESQRARKSTCVETKSTLPKRDSKGHTGKNNAVDENKFADYFKFSIPVKHAKSHQVMALNRGEKLKILSVKVCIHDSFWYKLQNMCTRHFLSSGFQSQIRLDLCQRSFKDAWDRLLQPMVCRQIRTELTQKAEKASLEVFSENLKNLLLIPPLKGRTVLGIDPGFKHGCKLSVVSSSGQLLHAVTIYPNFGIQDATRDIAAAILKDIVFKYGVHIAALGNGTACREVETWLGTLLAVHFFKDVDLSYAVVSEQGASIYSCSPEAKEEFPDLDPNLISSVSIARRLQEPLAELVKLEPKHLGVGMYQHDVPDSRLRAALDEVVQSCVSFVGVDLNTASPYLLRRVSGLSDARAKSILSWRNEHGPFICRQQLLQVKGVGTKTFEQCAGFVRVMAASSDFNAPSSSSESKKKQLEYVPTLLDSTNVHPETYAAAHELLNLSGVHLKDLGTQKFIAGIRDCVEKTDKPTLAKKLKLPDIQAVMQLIEALTQGPAYDPRALIQGPIFRRGLTSISDLCPGTELSGCVRNVTHFGAFVDIGVGNDGLLHVSEMRGAHLALGNRVSVRVKNVDVPRKRIGLEFITLLA